jgi:hypothetical protein
MIFEEFVRGRSIAVVGPAPMTEDQSALIDAHDLVYRPAQSPVGGRYGERIDIAYLNGQHGRSIYDDHRVEMRLKIEPATWWVFKAPGGYRRDGLHRRAIRTWHGGFNPNAITGILIDLVKHDTGPITVFGTDLYASGPERCYSDEYLAQRIFNLSTVELARAFLAHDPWRQMRLHRSIVATGKVGGDHRYLTTVGMDDETYQAVIDRWTAVLEEAA